jgi:hypothetical protein
VIRRWFKALLGAVVGRMAFALVVTLVVAVVAQAQSGSGGSERYYPVLYALLGGLVSGAVQWGAVRQAIKDHDRRIIEAHDLAGKAHDRMNSHVEAWHR